MIPTAALFFGAAAWAYTLYCGAHLSEREGIEASWVAIFPTAFGFVGRALRRRSIEAGAPRVFRPLGVAFLAGTAASLSLWFFFEGIWPSL